MAAYWGARTESGLANVHFGDRFVLVAAATETHVTGIFLQLTWRSLKDQSRDPIVAVYAVDASGSVLCGADYQPDPSHGRVAGNTLWHDSVFIPYDRLATGDAIEVGMVAQGQWLTPSSTKTSTDQHRLRVSLPKEMPRGTTPFDGHLDVVRCKDFRGWIWASDRPDEALEVEILVDGKPSAKTVANLARPDLRQAGKGNGAHGFLVQVPSELRDGQPHMISARVAGTRLQLNGGPKVLRCDPKRPPALTGGKPSQ